MTINRITYWHSTDITFKDTAKKPTSATLTNQNQTFNSTLFDILFANKRNTLWGGGFNSLSVDPLTTGLNKEALSKEVVNAKAMGLEKVLAEQLKAPLSFLAQNNNDYMNNNANSHSPFGRMTDLTMQLQIAKAKRAVSQQGHHPFSSFDEFVKQLSRELKS